jgi:hypothetical protein
VNPEYVAVVFLQLIVPVWYNKNIQKIKELKAQSQ